MVVDVCLFRWICRGRGHGMTRRQQSAIPILLDVRPEMAHVRTAETLDLSFSSSCVFDYFMSYFMSNASHGALLFAH